MLREGYVAETCIYLALPACLRDLDIPHQPTRAQVRGALRVWAEVVHDVPFKARSDRTNALAKALTPFVRTFFDAITPLFGITSPTARSGKGKTDNVTTIPALGSTVGETALPRGRMADEQLEKKLTGIFKDGKAFICWSNVEGTVNNPVLAMVITDDIYTDRVLGSSNSQDFVNRVNWSLTGNNVRFGGDMAGRVVPIRIDPNMEYPEERKGFRHPRLEAYVLEHRRDIVTALLMLVQAWVTAGMHKGTEIMGGFEAFTETLGGIIAAVGVRGFLEQREDITRQADEARQTWVAFVSVWYETHKRAPVNHQSAMASAARER